MPGIQKFCIKQFDKGPLTKADILSKHAQNNSFEHDLPTELPYLPVYKSFPYISWPLILEPKDKFFFFLGKNLFEKLIFYLRILFLVAILLIFEKFTCAYLFTFRRN